MNDPLYNHPVFGPVKGKGGLVGKTDEELIAQLISIHNAENWLGIEGEDGVGASVDIFGPPLPPLPPSAAPDDTLLLSVQSEPEPQLPSDLKRELGESSLPEPKKARGDEENDNAKDQENGQSTSTLISSEETPTPSQVLNSEDGPPAVIGGKVTVTVGTQTGDDEPLARPTSVSPATSTSSCTFDSSTASPLPSGANCTSLANFRNQNMTHDPHCYECKVRYRDPKPKDLVMYLHALSYKVSQLLFLVLAPISYVIYVIFRPA